MTLTNQPNIVHSTNSPMKRLVTNMQQEKKHLIFTYGTLKRGFWNHRLLVDAEFIGEFATASDYKIYCNGSYPYLIEAGSDKGVPVEGEIYRVSDAELARCDRLEGHPSAYTRKPIKIIYEIKDGKLTESEIEGVEAYIYSHGVTGCRECNTCWPKDRVI